MALQKQLEGSRIIRKGDYNPKVTPPPSKVVAGGKEFASRSTITPSKTCSADLYRSIKRRVGRSLKRIHCNGNLVLARKQTSHKLPETKEVFLALKEFQDLCKNNIVLIATDNTTVIAYRGVPPND